MVPNLIGTVWNRLNGAEEPVEREARDKPRQGTVEYLGATNKNESYGTAAQKGDIVTWNLTGANLRKRNWSPWDSLKSDKRTDWHYANQLSCDHPVLACPVPAFCLEHLWHGCFSFSCGSLNGCCWGKWIKSLDLQKTRASKHSKSLLENSCWSLVPWGRRWHFTLLWLASEGTPSGDRRF